MNSIENDNFFFVAVIGDKYLLFLYLLKEIDIGVLTNC
jgi:hypothetical protein